MGDGIAHPWITAAVTSLRGNVIEGYPQVLVKRGLHDSTDINPVPATTDADFHRPNDYVWIAGQIHGICQREEASYGSRTKAPNWKTEFWPEVVIRMGRYRV
jgi:hypothetical protein